MERFHLSWVGLCRIFKLANKVGYENSEIQSSLSMWFWQCTEEERHRLEELFPNLVSDVKVNMKKSDFYRNHVVLD
jgi:hypothetical protein